MSPDDRAPMLDQSCLDRIAARPTMVTKPTKPTMTTRMMFRLVMMNLRAQCRRHRLTQKWRRCGAFASFWCDLRKKSFDIEAREALQLSQALLAHHPGLGHGEPYVKQRTLRLDEVQIRR